MQRTAWDAKRAGIKDQSQMHFARQSAIAEGVLLVAAEDMKPSLIAYKVIEELNKESEEERAPGKRSLAAVEQT